MYMKHFGEFYDDQISHASCILLSRTQTASEEKIAAAVAMLREKNPTATIVTTAWDALTGEQILKAMSTKDDFKAELIAISENGKMYTFKVEAYDNKGLIGEGTHERAIIDCERFMKKCLAKLED